MQIPLLLPEWARATRCCVRGIAPSVQVIQQLNRHEKSSDRFMTTNNRIVLSSDHAAIQIRQTIAAHTAAQSWEVVDIGPNSAPTPSLLA
jgi:hypothetical protein